MTLGEGAAGATDLLGREAELRQVTTAVAAGRGVVIVGPAGVGKTSLATTATARHGAPTLFVRASRSLQRVPFGAIGLALTPGRAGLGAPADVLTAALDDADGLGPLSVMRTAHDAVVAFGGGRPPVLLVDDAHHVDDPTASLLLHLALGGHAIVVATMRSGAPHPEPIHLLWRDELCERVQLGALSERDVGRLVARQLEGEVEVDTVQRLFDVVKGNPLYLRELVNDALHAGTMVRRRALWAWEGTAGDTPRLSELVAATIGRLPEQEQAVVQCLALTGVLPMRVMEHVSSPEVLSSLESSGLIAVDRAPDGQGGVVTLGHPVFGEVFRPRRGSARAREHLTSVILGFGEYVSNAVDRLRLAEWRLETDAHIDPHELCELAEHAYGTGHKELSERLARLGIDQLGPAAAARAGVVLGEILVDLGRHAEADEVLAPLVVLDLPAPLLSRAIAGQLRALAHGMGQFARAAEEVAPHIERVDDPKWQAYVRAQWATVMARDGRFDEAISAVEPLRDHPDDLVRLRSVPAVNIVLCFSGRPEEARTVARSHVATALSRRNEIPFGPSWVGAALYADGLMSGRLEELDQLLELFRADPMHHVSANRANYALSRARISILRGKASEARRLASEAVSLYARSDPENARAMAIGALLEACGHLGDADTARAMQDEFREALVHGGDRLFGLEAERCAAWAHVAMGDVGAGADALLSVAASAAELRVPVLRAMALHDAFRLGSGKAVAAEVATATASFEGARFQAVHRHAEGRATDDPRAIEAAAEQFASLTMHLWAAEAFAEASRMYLAGGSGDGARRTAARLLALRAEVAGVVTPALLQPIEAEQLTRREAQIARLAGDGRTSREIADQLHVSVRTVEGHLGRVYDKLGVRSRAELATALGPRNG